MSPWIEFLLEVLKLTIPGALVLLAAYYVLKQYTESQKLMKQLDAQRELHKQTLPLKLQAYERLSLFCERIFPPALVGRIHTGEGTASGLRAALLAGIQQEYEHNLSQQIYISGDLWNIVRQAKNNTISLITSAHQELPQMSSSTADDLVRAIFAKMDEQSADSLSIAREAIRREAAIVL